MSEVISAFPQNFRAVVLGSSGAIGQAFMQLLEADPRCASVKGFCRSSAPGFSLEDEPSIIRCSQEAASGGSVHLVIDATGGLVIDGRGPEKRLEALSAEGLMRAMQVNAIGPALLMKHFDSVQPYSMNTVSVLVASANFAQASLLFCCAILPATKNVRTSTSVMLSTPMMKSRAVLVILLAAFLGVRQPQQPVL